MVPLFFVAQLPTASRAGFFHSLLLVSTSPQPEARLPLVLTVGTLACNPTDAHGLRHRDPHLLTTLSGVQSRIGNNPLKF